MAGGKRIDKHCECCGTLMVNVNCQKKFCYDCTKKRARAYQREHQREYNREYHKNYNRKRRKKANEIPGMYTVNPNKKYCKGCVYWGGAYENNFCCNYIFVEKHSRGCPPGKDCTKKVIGKRKYAMDFVTDCGVRG